MQERKVIKGVMFLFAFCATVIVAGICLDYGRVFDLLKSIPFVGGIIAYNFPPQDYYVPVVDMPLSKGECQVDFVCKYKGRHDFQIANISKDKFYDSGISIKLTISEMDGNNVIWSGGKDNSEQFAYYPNEGERGYRYWYDAFTAPDEIPLKTKMRLTVICDGDVASFIREHENAHIQVIKAFDK